MTVKVQRCLPFLVVKFSTFYIFYQEKKSYCEKWAHTDIFSVRYSPCARSGILTPFYSPWSSEKGEFLQVSL